MSWFPFSVRFVHKLSEMGQYQALCAGSWLYHKPLTQKANAEQISQVVIKIKVPQQCPSMFFGIHHILCSCFPVLSIRS